MGSSRALLPAMRLMYSIPFALANAHLSNRVLVMNRLMFAGLCAATTVAVGAAVAAQQLPDAPAKGFGTSITGAYEGWYDNPDGSHTFLIGYYNRNIKQALDIPVGPNNHIDPGGPDMGQPTHFLPGRQTGVFSITVPKAFAK